MFNFHIVPLIPISVYHRSTHAPGLASIVLNRICTQGAVRENLTLKFIQQKLWIIHELLTSTKLRHYTVKSGHQTYCLGQQLRDWTALSWPRLVLMKYAYLYVAAFPGTTLEILQLKPLLKDVSHGPIFNISSRWTCVSWCISLDQEAWLVLLNVDRTVIILNL